MERGGEKKYMWSKKIKVQTRNKEMQARGEEVVIRGRKGRMEGEAEGDGDSEPDLVSRWQRAEAG